MQAEHVVHDLLTTTCSTMHQTRRSSLEATVLAALSGTRLTVTDLGRSIRSSAKQKHCIKRADRVLSNAHLHRERLSIYTALSRGLIAENKRPVIIVDWSDLDACKRHFLLRAAVALNARALTLYEEVHTTQTKEKPKTHLDFLRKLKAMLAADCCPIIVSDAGFRVPWFKLVASLGWDWVGRVRNRTFMQVAGTASWVPAKSLYHKASISPQALGAAHMAQSNPIECQLVLYKGKPKGRGHTTRLGSRSRASHSRRHATRAREPWLLATSLAPGSSLAKQVVRVYALRMQIEEAFRDLKSTRFGLSLELHLSYHVQRVQILLLIAALALMVAWVIGKATELTHQHRHYQANTVKDRVVLSTIFLGLRVIHDARTTLQAQDIAHAWQRLDAIIQSQCASA